MYICVVCSDLYVCKRIYMCICIRIITYMYAHNHVNHHIHVLVMAEVCPVHWGALSRPEGRTQPREWWFSCTNLWEQECGGRRRRNKEGW